MKLSGPSVELNFVAATVLVTLEFLDLLVVATFRATLAF